MPCALHVLNADGRLTDWMQRINDAFATSKAVVASRIPVDSVDVIVYNDADYVVPELGMSGFCTSQSRMYLPMDVENPALSKTFESVFQSFFAHELHHCARRNFPGFADTLGQALVTEGLACCFEAELPDGAVPMYATRIRGEALGQVRALAAPALNQVFSGWGEWFFGERAPDIPLHAGYTLGYEIVSAWLLRHDMTAAAAYGIPASQVLAEA